MTQSVRILYVAGGEPREEVALVEDGKLNVEKFVGSVTTTRLLPDSVVIVSVTSLERQKVTPRHVAGMVIHGDFCVSRFDSTCSPVSLTDDQVAFYKDAVAQSNKQQVERSLGPTRTIEIANVTVRYEKVEVPAECKCGADLTRDESVYTWAFHDESDLGRFLRHSGEENDVRTHLGVVLSEINGLKAGETFIHNIAIVCVACGNTLVEGDLDVYEPLSGDAPTSTTKETDDKDKDRKSV